MYAYAWLYITCICGKTCLFINARSTHQIIYHSFESRKRCNHHSRMPTSRDQITGEKSLPNSAEGPRFVYVRVGVLAACSCIYTLLIAYKFVSNFLCSPKLFQTWVWVVSASLVPPSATLLLRTPVSPQRQILYDTPQRERTCKQVVSAFATVYYTTLPTLIVVNDIGFVERKNKHRHYFLYTIILIISEFIYKSIFSCSHLYRN